MNSKQTYIAPAIEVIEIELESTSCIAMSQGAIEDPDKGGSNSSNKNFWGE